MEAGGPGDRSLKLNSDIYTTIDFCEGQFILFICEKNQYLFYLLLIKINIYILFIMLVKNVFIFLYKYF